MLSKNDELFLTVAKSESISKAAEQLYISQPSLTNECSSWRHSWVWPSSTTRAVR